MRKTSPNETAPSLYQSSLRNSFPVKILAYTHAYPGMGHQAGGETSLHDALRYLSSQGHEVCALVGDPTPVPSYEIDGVFVRTVQTDAESKAAPLSLTPWADVVVTQLKCAYRGSVIAQMFKKPVVHYAHNDHSATKKLLGQYASIGLYNTEWVKRSFEDSAVYTPGMVLHPVVEPERYAVDSTEEYVTLINLSMGGDGLYDKGWQTFFELARRNPKLRFLGVHGAYGEQAYEELPNVTYMPHQSDIREVYRKTRVLLVPSKYESYGRVAVEAAASGIPSICTPTDGLREAMGDSAMYAPYGDYDAWNSCLGALLRKNRLNCGEPKARSELLWEQSQKELEELGLMFQILASGGVRDYYDYVSVR